MCPHYNNVPHDYHIPVFEKLILDPLSSKKKMRQILLASVVRQTHKKKIHALCTWKPALFLCPRDYVVLNLHQILPRIDAVFTNQHSIVKKGMDVI